MEDRLAFALDLARQAGALLREGYGRAMQVEHKSEIDLVTEHDLRSERLLIEAIRDAYPGEGIVSEEAGSEGTAARAWYLDPLDGTTNFAHGFPVFAVSIAYAEGSDIRLGVVYDPLREEAFHATAGGGAWLNGQRLRVSAVDRLERSLLATGFPYDLRTNPDNNLNHFAAFSMRVQAVRRLGSAALDLAYVAAGRLDGFWELRLNAWDVAAGALLVREAGGVVTDLLGNPDVLATPTSVVASNGRIHEAMLEVLRGGGPQP